jgi:hypothetical protein
VAFAEAVVKMVVRAPVPAPAAQHLLTVLFDHALHGGG